MRIILKNICITLLSVLLVISLAIPCFAQVESGKIIVTLEDKEKNQINGLKVAVCQIAELNDVGYFPAKPFENSGISIAGILNNANESIAKNVADYIKKNKIETISATSENGKASFEGLSLGIWIVLPEENGEYTFNPYIVFLPFKSGGKLYYEVTSVPKLEQNVANEISIYVIKKWEDKNNASKKRPDSVTLELLNGKSVVGSIVLSEENGWAHTFSRLQKDGNYSVREKEVANYKAEYSGDAVNGFVITNTYAGEKLPQTGQHWWPIAVIAVAGICFVLLGIYEIGAKKNGKKK